MDDLLTTAEAADVLGVCASRIRQLVARRRLPVERTVSHVHLVRRSDVEALRQRKTRPGPAASHDQKGNT